MSLIFSNENRILFNKKNANQLLELTYNNRFIPLRDIFTLKVNEKNEVENTKFQKVTSYKAGVTYKKSKHIFCTSNTSLRVLHINSLNSTSLNRFLMKSSLPANSTLPMDYRRIKQLIQNKKKGEKLIIQKQRASTYKSTFVPYKAELCTHSPLQSSSLRCFALRHAKLRFARGTRGDAPEGATQRTRLCKAELCTCKQTRKGSRGLLAPLMDRRDLVDSFATRSPKIQNDKTFNFKSFLFTTNSNIFNKKLLQSFSLEKVQYYACAIVPRMSIWGFAFGSCFLLVIMTSILKKHEQNRWCFPFLKCQMPGLYTCYQENSWESFENIISKYLIRDKEMRSFARVSKDLQGLQRPKTLYVQGANLNKLRQTSKDMAAQTCQACLVKKIDLQKNQLYINFSEVWNLQLIKDFAGLFSCSDSALRCVQSSALQAKPQDKMQAKRSFAKNMLIQRTYNVMPSIKSQRFLEPFYKMHCRIPRHHLSISSNANSSVNIITTKLSKRFAFKERMFFENNTIPSKMSSSANTVFAENYKIRNIATFEKGKALNENKKDNATYRGATKSSLFNKSTLGSDLTPYKAPLCKSANFCNNAVLKKFLYEYGFFSIPAKALFTPSKEQDILKTNLPKTQLEKTIFSSLPILQSVEPKKSFGKPISIINQFSKTKSPLYTFPVDKKDNFNKGNAPRCTYKVLGHCKPLQDEALQSGTLDGQASFGESSGVLNTPIDKSSCYNLYKTHTIGSRFLSGYRSSEIKNLQTSYKQKVYIKVPPALPFYFPSFIQGIFSHQKKFAHKKVWVLWTRLANRTPEELCKERGFTKWSFVRTFLHDVPHFRVYPKPSLTQVSDFHHKKQLIDKQYITCKNFKIRTLKKMPYRQLALNEFQEIQPLFEKVNQENRISPYKMDFEKPLFTDYHDYLSRPKDSPGAIAISPSLEEDQGIQQSWTEHIEREILADQNKSFKEKLNDTEKGSSNSFVGLEEEKGFNEEEKKNEITKWEWLQDVRDSESDVEKRKDFQMLAYPKKEALLTKRLLAEKNPKTPLQNFLVSDRKSSFFGITNIFPKRLIAEDQRQINNQILGKDDVRRSIEFFIALNKKKSNIKNVIPLSLQIEDLYARIKPRFASASTRSCKFTICKERGLQSGASYVRNKAFKPVQPQTEIRALQKTCLNLNKQTAQQVQSILSFDNVSRTERKEMNCYPPVYTPNRRLRLRVTESSKNTQNNNSQSRIDSLNLCQSHRWWQKRRASSSLLGAPSKRYMVMPEITRSDWTKILEWQLKTYFLEEEKRLQPLFLNKIVRKQNNQKQLIAVKESSAKPVEISRNLKIKKIAIYLPWLTLKKALKKPFEWPLTRLSYQSQTLRNNNQSNPFTLNKHYSANLRFPFTPTNSHSLRCTFRCITSPVRTKLRFVKPMCAKLRFAKPRTRQRCKQSSALQRTCLCKKSGPYKAELCKQIGFVTKKNKIFENKNELQIEDTSWFTVNKKPDSCLISSLSPQFKTLSLKLKAPTLAKASHKSKVYKHFIFEIISKDSHLLIHQLFLAIAIKQVLLILYDKISKTVIDKIKNSSLGIALLPLFFNAYSRENQTSTRYHLKKRLKDVVGSEDTISSLSEIVWYLRNSCRGRMVPRGVVLLETHDSESTEFLKAVGGEAQVPVIVQSLRALPFTQNHPQRRLEKILKFAQKCAPCILFLDDLDAIGKERPLLINGTKDNTRFNRSAKRNDAFTKTSFVQRGVSIGNEKQKWKGYNWIKPNRLNSILFRKSKSQEAHILLLDHFLASRGSYTGACSLDKKCINKHLQKSACVARTRLTKLYKPPLCTTFVPSTNSTLSANTSVESRDKTSSNSITSETEKTLNQRRLDLMLRLLTVMDGISHLKGVLIVTTSKNPGSLDPALLRPGRFERFINLKLPSKKRRIQLLKMQTSKIGHTNFMPWEYLAEETENMSGASISNAINHSAFKAIIQSTTHTPVTLEYGINRVKGEVLTSNKNLSFNFPKFIRKRREFLKSCNTSCTGTKVLSQKYFTTRASIKVASPFGDITTNSAFLAKRSFAAYSESKKSGVLLFKRNLCTENDRSCLTTQQELITPLQNDFYKINQISGFTSLTSFYQAGKGVLQSLLIANKVNVRILDFTQNLVKLYAGRASQSLYLDSTLRSRTKLRFVSRCISTYKAPLCKVTCNPTFKNNVISFSFLQSNVSYIEQLEAISYISSILNYSGCNFESRVSLQGHVLCKAELRNADSAPPCTEGDKGLLVPKPRSRLYKAELCTYRRGLQGLQSFTNRRFVPALQKRSRAKLRMRTKLRFVRRCNVPALYVRHTCVRTFLHSACTFTKPSFVRASERSKDYWVEEKTCDTFKIFKRPTGNWYRLYLPELEQNKSNQEWRIPDCFFYQSNSLLNVKSVLQNGKHVILSKDICYSNIVSSFFYTSFQNLSENRELLDLFADHLIRFKSLQSHEIRRISLFYMNPNLI